ncbi:hypothetical protein MKUB_38730 [Mycobacterium kubicae]|nr:hypothetical protein MYCODSM44623_00825 [Mycobacterium intracellulare subsp. chimaera]BBN46303.1 hypothetical protein JPH1_07780 [Mycobacterium avium subsp. hominissuis]BBZ47435.1 hypothetical protein MPRM_47160 [Mycobacterium parmense]GFG66383.1 hypothetical protein MKUB_38730 [Mycobacterium kubicae]
MPTGWELIECVVSDGLSGARQIHEELRGGALAEPDGDAAWIIGVGKSVRQWLQLRRYLAIRPG